MTGSGWRGLNGREHPDAYRLIEYLSVDGADSETIWNSTPGPAPYLVQLRNGKAGFRIAAGGAGPGRGYRPRPGTRMFAAATADEARAAAEWAWPELGGGYRDVADLAGEVSARYAAEGAVRLVEVGGPGGWRDLHGPRPDPPWLALLGLIVAVAGAALVTAVWMAAIVTLFGWVWRADVVVAAAVAAQWLAAKLSGR